MNPEAAMKWDAETLADQIHYMGKWAASDPALFRRAALKELKEASDKLAELVGKCGN